MLSLAPQGPFDPDYDVWADPPRRHFSHAPQHQTHRPRLAPICPWCMERFVSPETLSHLNHPGYSLLCHECRINLRMFVQRLALHRAMTTLQATRAVFDLLDLDNRLLPE